MSATTPSAASAAGMTSTTATPPSVPKPGAPVRECEGLSCIAPAKHYTSNPSSQRNFHLCYAHMELHRQGHGFSVKATAHLLTDPAPTAILEQHPTPKEAPTMAYNSALSTLQSSRDEIREAIQAAQDRQQELNDAINDMESALESIQEAVDALENLDGFSVSVDVESLELYVSIDL